ncbi:hypothetical protein GIB67_032531 [Kingdonia uniflora]|uniref:DUF4283 domain-containing protein n=1 Tax=Kingdonia uniflora TaxID=39325 RepID=A0A7J7L7N2_9MAGN|nr:hypothetical protein GIB67_032531 [Kingdonia uniflora]
MEVFSHRTADRIEPQNQQQLGRGTPNLRGDLGVRRGGAYNRAFPEHRVGMNTGEIFDRRDSEEHLAQLAKESQELKEHTMKLLTENDATKGDEYIDKSNATKSRGSAVLQLLKGCPVECCDTKTCAADCVNGELKVGICMRLCHVTSPNALPLTEFGGVNTNKGPENVNGDESNPIPVEGEMQTECSTEVDGVGNENGQEEDGTNKEEEIDEFPPLGNSKKAQPAAAATAICWASKLVGTAHHRGKTKLSLIPPMIVNGITVVNLYDEDFKDTISEHEKFVVGNFVGRKLAFPFVRDSLKRLWELKGSFEMSLRSNNTFFFKFCCEDREKVLGMGPQYLASRLFVIRPWRPLIENEINELKSVPIWVNLWNVPSYMWTDKGLSAIASAIGTSLSIDKATEEQTRTSFARVCVEVAWIVNTPRCNECAVFGHNKTNCPKASRGKKVEAWLPTGPNINTNGNGDRVENKERSEKQQLSDNSQPQNTEGAGTNDDRGDWLVPKSKQIAHRGNTPSPSKGLITKSTFEQLDQLGDSENVEEGNTSAQRSNMNPDDLQNKNQGTDNTEDGVDTAAMNTEHVETQVSTTGKELNNNNTNVGEATTQQESSEKAKQKLEDNKNRKEGKLDKEVKESAEPSREKYREDGVNATNNKGGQGSTRVQRGSSNNSHSSQC